MEHDFILIVKINRNGKRILLCDHNIRGVIIPKGFITDGHSVPKLLWWFIQPMKKGFDQAIIHDFRYQTRNVSRKEADREYRENLLKHSSIMKFRISVAYWSLRFCGWYVYYGVNDKLKYLIPKQFKRNKKDS